MGNKIHSITNKIDRFVEQHKKAIKGIKILLLLFLLVIMGYVVYLSHVFLAVMAIYNGITDTESLTSLVAVCSLLTFVLVGVMWHLVIQLYILFRKK